MSDMIHCPKRHPVTAQLYRVPGDRGLGLLVGRQRLHCPEARQDDFWPAAIGESLYHLRLALRIGVLGA